MISINYGTLRSDSFRNAFFKIGNCEGVTQDTALKVIDVSKKLEEKLVESQKEWIDLMRGLVPSENGMFKLNEEKTDFVWLDGVDPEKGKQDIMNFAKKTVEVEGPKLSLEELKEVKLSPVELALLEPVLEKIAH